MRPLRSFLFIPGDSQKKLAKVDDCQADAVILDLEDAVSPASKGLAREMVAEFLGNRPAKGRPIQLWVRINPLDSGLVLDDLVAIIKGAPDGILQPKTNGPADVRTLSHYLDALEVHSGIVPGAVKIIPVATETARAPFSLGDYADAGLERLAGLTWGAEDLSAAIGASTNLSANGQWAFTYQLVRSMTLMAAHAAGVPAIETVYVDFKDTDGLRSACRSARSEGFGGRIAIHPAQVVGINESFSPTDDEVEFARRVVAAFGADDVIGTVGIDGKMYDIPHLKAAKRVLSLADLTWAT